MENAGDIDAAVRRIIDDMTPEEKVGQLFVVEVYGQEVNTTDANAVRKNEDLYFVKTPAEVIEKYKPGGIVYFGPSRGNNLGEVQKIAELSNGLQTVAMRQRKAIPLLISIDQEGGSLVFRLPHALVTNMPGNMALGAVQPVSTAVADARTAAKVIGKELAALGINQNFAPVADVNVNPANPVIGMRSFGESANLVRDLVAAQVEGYREGGVTMVAKHFPGHGNTTVDSHFGLSEVPHTRQQLRDIDLKPFVKAIAAGIDTIMTGHLIVKALDPSGVPATMSPQILTGELRERLSFDGIIITDGLDMAGATIAFPPAVAPLEAFKAGADQLLLAPQMDLAYNAILYALRNKDIAEERVNESVHRILRLKMKRGLFDNPHVDVAAAAMIVGSHEHLAEARAIAERATTLIRNDDGLLPLSGNPRKVLVTGWSGPMAVTKVIQDELTKRGHTVKLVDIELPAAPMRIDEAVAHAAQSDLVVVSTSNAAAVDLTTRRPTDNALTQQRLVNALVATGRPVVACAMRNPYDVSRLPFARTQLATYGSTPASAQALVRILFGEIRPSGKLPVAIQTADGSLLYPAGHGLTFSG